MITFKSLDDLKQLDKNHSAYSLLDDLGHRLLVDSPKEGFFYDPEAHGYLALLFDEDLYEPLHQIWPDGDWTLMNIPFEGVFIKDNYFHICYQANNEFCILMLIENTDQIKEKLHNKLLYHLDP